MGIKVFNQNFQKFRIYLREKIFLKEKYIPFYINWVKQAYNKFELNEDHPMSNKQIQQYIKELSHTHPDWQIQQAKDALRHYTYFYRTSNTRNMARQIISFWLFSKSNTR